jgi:hypothetical protein
MEKACGFSGFAAMVVFLLALGVFVLGLESCSREEGMDKEHGISMVIDSRKDC